MADGSATVLGARVEATLSSRAEARVTASVLEAGAEKHAMPEEQMMLPKA